MAERTVLGERLLVLRRRKGMTQKALGEAVGLSPWTIARIEQGRSPQILTGALERLSRELGVSSDYLLGLSDDVRPPQRRAGDHENPLGTPIYAAAVESTAYTGATIPL